MQSSADKKLNPIYLRTTAGTQCMPSITYSLVWPAYAPFIVICCNYSLHLCPQTLYNSSLKTCHLLRTPSPSNL